MPLVSTSRSALSLAALVALLAGCFTEPNEGTTTSGMSCDLGSFGCECLEGVCEPDLECTPSNVCIPEDCTPGTAVCECDPQGNCGPNLVCTANVCLPMGGTSVGTSDTEGTSMSATTSATSTTNDTTTGPDVSTTEGVDSSTTDAETSTGPSDTTDMPMSCGEEDITCEACFTCTNQLDCEAQFDTCQGIPDCLIAADCIEDCAAGVCFDDCCAGESAALRSAAEALHTCRANTCIIGPCDAYAPIPSGFCGS